MPRRILLALACACLTGPVHAELRVYEGTEAQALKCAAYFSYATYMLETRGLITPRNRQEGVLAATSIIGNHVGGSYEQKRKAFQAVLERLPDSDDTVISDSLRYLTWCSERFLN